MNTPKALLILFALFATIGINAQDEAAKEEDPNNLVPNPGFEEYEDRLRRDGQFDLTTSWFNPTPQISDLFASEIKSRYVAVPDNKFGTQEPFEGGNYAGVVMYSFRNRVPRTYISVELKSRLKKNGLYCVRYRASLAERSMHAVNNLGAHLSSSKPSLKSAISMELSDAVLSDKNEIVTDTEGWWQYCTRINAKGGERYLTLGNFMPDSRTNTREVPLADRYAEEGAEPMAYYYIDDVEVYEVAANETCGCAGSKIPESKVIFSSTTPLTDDMTITEKVEAVDVYFYQYQSDVVSIAQRSIDKIIELLEANPMMRIRVIGHTDNEEAELAKTEMQLRDLGNQRAMKVMTYMVSKGIDRKRIITESVDNKEPASTRSTPLSIAQNRRVEFKIAL